MTPLQDAGIQSNRDDLHSSSTVYQPAEATDLGHELRTPLTCIRGAIGLLLSGRVGAHTEQGRRLLEIVAKNVDRLVRLTDTLQSAGRCSLPTISPAQMELLRLEADLHSALESNEFQLFYQPIVCPRTGDIKSFEALLRWLHPTRGFVPPGTFIPIAEESQLIHQLGLWVLREACLQLSQWQERFPGRTHSLGVSVNVSATQILQPDFVRRTIVICEEAGISPTYLHVEITESVLMANSHTVMAILHQLKNLGIRLHLDDFGTGYSCLSYLQDFPFDSLKVDRSFVSKGQWSMICAILQIAESLGVEAIVEGIETAEELENVRKLGCKEVQGFLFSKPVGAKQASDLLERGLQPNPAR